MITCVLRSAISRKVNASRLAGYTKMRINGKIERTLKVKRSPRVLQVEGKYDLPPIADETAVWDIDITLPEGWRRGVIVGASGSGKTSVARFIAQQINAVLQTPRDEKGRLVEPHVWGADTAVIEDIAGEEGSVDDAMMLLTSVGFSSPPAWRRPFGALSIGQQFRASLARTLLEQIEAKRGGGAAKPIMIDEYAGPLDRHVAQFGSEAIANATDRYDLQFVAVTPHEYVIAYLRPDWILTVHDDKTMTFEVRPADASDEDGSADGLARRWVRRRFDVRLARASDAAWARFSPHHYLNHELSKSALKFVAEIDGKPVGFAAAIHFPQQKYGLIYREHRIVVHPDYQGIGIGNRISELLAACFKATGHPYFSLTSHPAMIAHRKRSALWRMTKRGIGVSNGSTGLTKGDGKCRRTSVNRLTAAFEYVGPADERGAAKLGILRMVREREATRAADAKRRGERGEQRQRSKRAKRVQPGVKPSVKDGSATRRQRNRASVG